MPLQPSKAMHARRGCISQIHMTLEEIFGWKMNSNSKYLTVQVISKVIRNSIDDSSSSPRWGDDDDGLRTNPNKPGVGTDHVW